MCLDNVKLKTLTQIKQQLAVVGDIHGSTRGVGLSHSLMHNLKSSKYGHIFSLQPAQSR